MLLLTSCSPYDFDRHTARQLEGTWRFEKVTYNKFLSFNPDNITEKYSDMEWKFQANGAVEEVNRSTNESWSGTWQLRELPNGDGTSISEIDIALRNDNTGETKSYDLDGVTVSKKCFMAYTSRDGGTYRYNLEKK